MALTFGCGKIITLVAVYAPTSIGQTEYFRDLEKFFVTSHSIVLLGEITQSVMYAWIMLAQK